MTDFYRAISDPIRRRTLTLVSHKELTQSELVANFSISQPALKKHLAILIEENLITERRDGRYCFYRLKREVFYDHYQKLQHELGSILENKLVKLKDYLEEDNNGESH
ncbi:ArsR/SmtB family transcription factor [Psychrobacillus vulpis]|uniref:Winged helix-turn-helix transcriptional regulator n=1 Tax=Psychrobacillus vulpis TaxID=2325572 RepID=A0A544TSP2_9BACI|nr:metalloregulator ArsR/SmtB family transcription factor [Psychrobacillus vulpis]TQR20454.1 winged helix-turn-helix transcriptional regulator [Psychrobacillus vulpis]